VNCKVPPEGTVELPGESAMRADAPALDAAATDCMVLPHAVMPKAEAKTTTIIRTETGTETLSVGRLGAISFMVKGLAS
jgi:hypothetical protein